MSSFRCETCGTICNDTHAGYVTGCEHFPVESQAVEKYLLWCFRELDNSLPFLARIAAENGHFTAMPLKRWSEDLKTTIGIMLGGKAAQVTDSQTATVHAQQP